MSIKESGSCSVRKVKYSVSTTQGDQSATTAMIQGKKKRATMLTVGDFALPTWIVAQGQPSHPSNVVGLNPRQPLQTHAIDYTSLYELSKDELLLQIDNEVLYYHKLLVQFLDSNHIIYYGD